MKLLLLTASTAALVCASLLPLSATSVTTDPVGYVTFNVNANSDQRLGVPLQRPAVLVASAASVSQAVVQASGIESLTGAHFLLVTSGDAEGQWEEITSSTSGEVTIAEAIPGFVAGDRFAIRPFWTLDTLFPNGGAVPASSDVFSPAGFILLNNPNAVGINLAPASAYFYHDGSQGDAGWYNANDYSPAGIKTISPEVSIIIRNQTSSNAAAVISGTVLMSTFCNSVVQLAHTQQDNLIYNPHPIPISLAGSGLVSSGAISPSSDVFSPVDQVLIYNFNNNGVNTAPSSAYLYHDGSQGDAGWYNLNTFELADNVEIPGGGAFIIRRGSGINGIATWDPPLPL